MSINYHPEIVWFVNKALVVLAVLLSLSILAYAAVRELFSRRRARRLASIESNLKELAKSNPYEVKNICPEIMGRIEESEIFRILYDNERVSFGELGEGLKQCLVDSGRLVELEHIASASRNKWRRIQALISIGYAASPNALKILAGSVLDKDEDIAYFSMLALFQIKNIPSAKILLDCLARRKFDGHRILSLLERFPAEIIDEVLRVTYHSDAVVRFWAVKLLGRIKSNRSVGRLIELAKDESADVRAAACEALGNLKVAQARDTVKNCLQDPAWFVRLRGVSALVKIAGAESIADIRVLERDESWLVRDKVKGLLKG